jgi:TolB protein
MMRLIYFGILAIGMWVSPALSQNGPLKIEITDGVIEPLTFAVPIFEAENIEAAAIATEISRIDSLRNVSHLRKRCATRIGVRSMRRLW